MVFIKKPIEEDPRITIRKICERCDVSVGTATRIVRDDLNLREIAARWIALLLTDQQKKQRVECSKDLCSRCLNQMDPNAFATSSQVMRPGCTVVAFLTNGPIKCGWLLTGRDQLCFHQVFGVGRTVFPVYQHAGSNHGWHDSTTGVNTHCNTPYQNCSTRRDQISPSAAPNRRHRKTPLLHDNTTAHKAKVTVTFLQEKNMQVLAHLPYSPGLVPCGVQSSPSSKKIWLVGNFPAFRTS